MKKIYVTPKATAIECRQPVLYSGSVDYDKKKYYRNSFCKHWHFCNDRYEGRMCHDKEY